MRETILPFPGHNWGMKLPKGLLETFICDPESEEPIQYFERNPDLGGDESRILARKEMVETADAQIRDFQPAREAYARMVREGISEFDARMFIANLLAKQVWIVFKSQKPCNEEIYAHWLSRLPEQPSEEGINRLAAAVDED